MFASLVAPRCFYLGLRKRVPLLCLSHTSPPVLCCCAASGSNHLLSFVSWSPSAHDRRIGGSQWISQPVSPWKRSPATSWDFCIDAIGELTFGGSPDGALAACARQCFQMVSTFLHLKTALPSTECLNVSEHAMDGDMSNLKGAEVS